MDSWRRRRNDNNYRGGARMRSHRGKPPLGSWKPTVPEWEKKFCWEVGRVPWWKLVETNKLLYMYDDMLKWDDSAVKEAFHNAKERYWAGLNGLPYDIPIPDPNAHIDEVDWDFNVDPELILDLDRDFVGSNDGERVLLVGDDFAKSKGLTTGGWGDEEEVRKDGQEVQLTEAYLERLRRPQGTTNVFVDHGGGWDNVDPWESKVKEKADGEENNWGTKVEGGGWGNKDPWESKVKESAADGGNRGWGAKVEETGNVEVKGWGDDSGWKQWENKVNSFGNNQEDGGQKTARFNDQGRVSNQWGSHRSGEKLSNNNNWNNRGGYYGNYRESSGRQMSRYKTTRFYGDGQANNQWEGKNRYDRKKDDFARDQNRSSNYHGAW